LAAANSKVGVFSIWTNTSSLDGNGQYIDSDGQNFRVNHDMAGIQFFAKNPSSVTKLLVTLDDAAVGGGGVTTDSTGVWLHILFGWNLGTGDKVMVLNGVDVTADCFISTFNNDVLDWSEAINWYVGIRSAGGLGFNGCVSDFYLNVAEYIDFTNADNIALFIDSNGKPVDLGADGSTPTGTQPAIYFKGGAVPNLGYAGSFTETGATESCASSPSD